MRGETARSVSNIRAAATKSAPENKQKRLRQRRDASSMGAGPTSPPGTVWKMDLEARRAQMVGGRVTASRDSRVATARRAVVLSSLKRLQRLLPAAVQKSQVASRMPNDISLPLKTTISSRMRTIWPMTALKPMSARAVAGDAGLVARGVGTGLIGASIRTELKASWCGKAREAKRILMDDFEKATPQGLKPTFI